MPKSKKNTNNKFIEVFEFVSILIILFLTSFNLSNYSNTNNVLGASTENINNIDAKIIYLENVVKENPLYFDAYTELFKLNIDNNNIKNAEKYLDILKTINPNSQINRVLEKELNNLN